MEEKKEQRGEWEDLNFARFSTVNGKIRFRTISQWLLNPVNETRINLSITVHTVHSRMFQNKQSTMLSICQCNPARMPEMTACVQCAIRAFVCKKSKAVSYTDRKLEPSPIHRGI